MQSQDNQTPGTNDATLVSPRAQQGSARLILRRADGQLKEYGLEKDEISIGRLASNDVVLPDDRSVSRRHAVIRRSNVGYVIEDQQSNNGTYVDGEKILYPFVLHNGQSIKVGANELTFTMTGAQSKAPEQAEPARPASMTMPPAQVAPPEPGPQEPFLNQSASQSPTFELPSQQPAFGPPPQAAEFAPAAPGAQFPPPPAPGGFGQPQPAPPAPQFAPPPPPEPQPWAAQPPAAPQFPPALSYQTQPAPPGPASSGMVVCQSCGNPTMANKAFCLNCGAAMAPQSAPQAPAPGGPGAFGAAPGGFGQPQPGASQFPSPPGAAFGQAQPGPQPWPPQPQAQSPAWPAPQGQPQPGPQGWQSQQQGWPGQPAQPGPFGAPAPAAGPIDATVFFQKGLRPMQTSDIHVRLATQFAGPGLQPGATITVRVWASAQDAFFFSSPGITLRVPAPGGVEEGGLQATPMRPTQPGATDQLLFMVVDAASGQPLHSAPISAEVVISYQPAQPFDGPGSLRLPL